jgi:hypothetical protein
MDDKRMPDGIVLTEAQKRSRRQRSIAIALALGYYWPVMTSGHRFLLVASKPG